MVEATVGWAVAVALVVQVAEAGQTGAALVEEVALVVWAD